MFPQFRSVPANDPSLAGKLAAPKNLFGQHSRYAIAPVHTRFDAIEWFVWDAQKNDENGNPDVIRQKPTLEKALAGLED